jgi:tetratricopeptide (TPR) repeat protein
MQVSDTNQNPQNVPVAGHANAKLMDVSRYPREFVLFSYFALVLIFLGFTALVARMYHKNVHVLADGWFARGESELRAGNPAGALIDYRNALAYSPGNPVFQLHLAQALSVAGPDHVSEARSYLLNLLVESPGSGEINLYLARTSKDSIRDAMRYYSSAIYGYWENDPVLMRWNVRRELCDYLLNRGTIDQAQPQIIALAQEVPTGDLALQKEAAALLLRVNLWDRALDEYRAILTAHKHDDDALAGAGIASFHLGEYARAIAYFDELPAERRNQTDISSLLATTQDIQLESPFLEKLSDAERASRTLKAIALAEGHLDACASRPGAGSVLAPNSPAAQLQQLRDQFKSSSPNWTERSLAHDQSQIDAAMALVFLAENAAAAQCGEPQDPANHALLLIGQSQNGGEQ